MFDSLIAERLRKEASAAASEPRKKLPHPPLCGLMGLGMSARWHRRPITRKEWERINQLIAPIKARHLARKANKGSR